MQQASHAYRTIPLHESRPNVLRATKRTKAQKIRPKRSGLLISCFPKNVRV